MIYLKEIIDLFSTILFIPIPMPISFFGQTLYYNLFGVFIVFLLIFIVSLIIRKTTGGAGD